MVFKVQVKKEHYTENYDNFYRFSSYFYQIQEILKLNSKKILEIGVGNKTITNYLRELGLEVVTCDFDNNLKPDKVGDVRDLPFKGNSFDLVSCCEVLEHIPFTDVPKAVEEINRVTKKYVVISIPYSSLRLSSAIRIQDRLFNFNLRLPLFFLKIKFNGQHYWEMGRKNYSKNNIKKIIRNSGFEIIKEGSPTLNPWHYFFILKKIEKHP